ncbi:uncharacterized protein Z520_10152 [Fonsecaea multimorphosa CBS 102226]|uniref:Uncharacterized protein n=1 Tax=Fonsecaea multimorphosa CBS 102226 TaxID=1442371 RepID=A0A0D2IAE5_9EURO|nr:uncharacterized protein Z520_10152 [Fonsecaea multimorphosa CBS 102226]KIX94126.1 hypothetical protein Z520_10152 [Fonsecaea multimorphosa CBS 102226]OAL19479.1 hypothetical protein AYO22_09641 [Fonsecaea multimorphosa]
MEVPEDRLTAEAARLTSSKDVTALKVVTSAHRAADSKKTSSIKGLAESCEDDGQQFKLNLPKRLESKYKQADNMSETVTQYKHHHHLWLSTAAPEAHVHVPASDDANVPIIPYFSSEHKHYDNEVIIRSPMNITLDVIVRVVSGGKAAPESSSASFFNMTLPASKCSLLSDLRLHIAVTGSRDARLLEEATATKPAPPCSDDDDDDDDDGPGISLRLLRLVRDLSKVTFRLEEDGHVAKLNITPTRIDSSCVFPETEYEAWYYRNVLRGNQRVYTVEVKIEA